MRYKYSFKLIGFGKYERVAEEIKEPRPDGFYWVKEHGKWLIAEWLERLGFNKVPLSDESGHYFETQLPNGGYLTEGDRGGVCSCFVDGHTEWRVYTVHALQNLYFALCGQELKLEGVC